MKRMHIVFSDAELQMIARGQELMFTNNQTHFIREYVRIANVLTEAYQRGERILLEDSEGKQKELLLIEICPLKQLYNAIG